jgi:hypothetical protein
MTRNFFPAGRPNADRSPVVLYGTSVVKERVMTKASMSKHRQKGGDEAAVRERILEAAFAAFMKITNPDGCRVFRSELIRCTA